MMAPMETTIAGLNAVRRGSGEPMLLLHGIGHRWQMWLPLIDSLARDFEVVAVDLPGFGRSPRVPPGMTAGLDTATDHLETLYDHLGWDRAHLVGNSLGGWLAGCTSRSTRTDSWRCAPVPRLAVPSWSTRATASTIGVHASSNEGHESSVGTASHTPHYASDGHDGWQPAT